MMSLVLSKNRNFAFEHAPKASYLKLSKPNVLSGKAWLKWLSIKPYATLIFLAISIYVTYYLYILFIKIAGNLFGF